MQEYVTVSSSSYDPAGLATKLNEKSGEGWTVVAIVPTGGDVTAFLSRDVKDAADTADNTARSPDPGPAAAAAAGTGAAVAAEEDKAEATAAEPVSEPAGWASAPEKTDAAPAAAAAGIAAGGASVAAAQPDAQPSAAS